MIRYHLQCSYKLLNFYSSICPSLVNERKSEQSWIHAVQTSTLRKIFDFELRHSNESRVLNRHRRYSLGLKKLLHSGSGFLRLESLWWPHLARYVKLPLVFNSLSSWSSLNCKINKKCYLTCGGWLMSPGVAARQPRELV